MPRTSLNRLTDETLAYSSCKPSFLARLSCNCRQIPQRISLVEGFYFCQSFPPSPCLSNDVCSAVFLPALFAMSEIPSLFAMRPIIRRHHKAAMYHPFVEAIALTLVDVPITFIILLLYSIVLYFLVGLQRTAGQFLCVNPSSSTPLLIFGP